MIGGAYMAETDKKIYVQYKYKVEMTYLNLVKDIFLKNQKLFQNLDMEA